LACSFGGLDKIAIGNSGLSSTLGYFHRSRGECVGAFCTYDEMFTAFDTELVITMKLNMKIEKMRETLVKKLFYVCVTSFFYSWYYFLKFREQWLRSLTICSSIQFMVFHLFREENKCIESVTNQAIFSNNFFLVQCYAYLFQGYFFTNKNFIIYNYKFLIRVWFALLML